MEAEKAANNVKRAKTMIPDLESAINELGAAGALALGRNPAGKAIRDPERFDAAFRDCKAHLDAVAEAIRMAHTALGGEDDDD